MQCEPEEEVTLTATAVCHCLTGGDQDTCPIHKNIGSVFAPHSGCTCGGHTDAV